MKKIISTLLVFVMLFAVMAPVATVSAVNERTPIVYIRGNGDGLYYEDGTLCVAQFEDLNFGGKNYRNMIPGNRWLTWWGDQLVHLDVEECYLVDKKTGKETLFLTVEEINKWLGCTPENGLWQNHTSHILFNLACR